MSRVRRKKVDTSSSSSRISSTLTKRSISTSSKDNNNNNNKNSNNNNNRSSSNTYQHHKKQKTINFGRNDEYEDDDDDQSIDSNQVGEDNEKDLEEQEQEEEEETVDAKKIRLAREYLHKLQTAKGDDDEDDEDSSDNESSSQQQSDDNNDDDMKNDDSETEHDRIAIQLQRKRLEQEGTYERAVADKVQAHIQHIQNSFSHHPTTTTTLESAMQAKEWIQQGHIRLFRGHDLTPTCVALQANGERAISGSKDHSVLVWDVERECRAFQLCSTWKKKNTQESSSNTRTMGQILSVACSDDGQYVAVGRRDATVCIYDVRVNNTKPSSTSESFLIKTFTGHKGPITSLCFRTQTLQLFSASDDRCIRHYNLNEMMYLETLYGHQFGVTNIDCHQKERPISVGRDRTARAWKLAQDTHLIFRGGAKIAAADCVRIIKDDWFMTGHEDGHLGLWMTEKKRAVATVDHAHGLVVVGKNNVPRSITALASLRGSDLAISGSFDGYLRLWKLKMGQTLDSRSLDSLSKIPLHGYVNGIAVGPKARFCVVAVGQEPKMGRWNRVPGAKNRFGVVRLLPSKHNVDADVDDGDHHQVDIDEKHHPKVQPHDENHDDDDDEDRNSSSSEE